MILFVAGITETVVIAEQWCKKRIARRIMHYTNMGVIVNNKQ
jgi:hypothetical protein